VLVTPRRHALAKRRRLAFRDVLDQDFVGLPTGSALQVYIDGQASRAGRPLKTRVRLSGFDATCKVVESGIGIAVVSKIAAERCKRSMAIAVVPLSDAWALRRLRICARSFRALPAPARELVDALRPGSA
jgi:DNA-binding transcriptional LysR family regulator